MKKIFFVIMAVIFCTANYSAAATLNDGKEKNVRNVKITIGDWKINGKVDGKIYISDDSKKDKKGRTKLGNCDAVTYADGAIIVNVDEKRIEQWVDELEQTLGNIEINGECINYNAWESNQSRIKGSGNIITKKIPADFSYDAIKASRGVTVTMNDKEEDQIVIYADDNVMPYVVVRKEGNSLVVGIDDNIRSISSVNVHVILPKNSKLNELKAASAATININTTIEGRSLSLDAASAAKINIAKANVDFFDADAASAADISGAVKSDDCYVDASSAANINLTILAVQCKSSASSAANIKLRGEAATFEGDASSAAKIRANELAVHSAANAEASSGAKITVNPIKKLNAKASSGASIEYVPTDELVKNIKQSSGGRVREF